MGHKELDKTEWLSLSLSPSQGPTLSPPLGYFKALGLVLLPTERGSAPKLTYRSYRSLCIDDFDLKWLLIGRIWELGNFLLIDFVTCPAGVTLEGVPVNEATQRAHVCPDLEVFSAENRLGKQSWALLSHSRQHCTPLGPASPSPHAGGVPAIVVPHQQWAGL